jgi:signal transduction histidine kinase
MGLGLALIFALAGLVVLGLRLRRLTSIAVDMELLSDGAVLIVEDGTVIEASAQAVDLLGPIEGRQVYAVLHAFLGPDSDTALAALVALERSGDAIRLLTTDAAGRPFELEGHARGSHLRLVLRDAGLLDAELHRALAENAAHGRALSQREIETQTLAGLLADGPLVAWNRTQDGHIAWSAGQIANGNDVVTAAEAAALAVARAQAQAELPEQSDCGEAPGSAERFRLTIADAKGGPATTLDTIETIGAAGARLGIAIDASGILRVERSLERFGQTMTETFAHLNVGLAIFDRNQTLAIFNPALVQIWQADASWLAGRPSLREIIDSLRANRRIPEVSDFREWRERLINLFENAETVDYEELWHLADGADIKVLARPHPHGSLAFLFEDVTERLRLGQQFRHSVDLRRATLDRLDEGLAVFGPDGLLQLVNAAFHEIWGTNAEIVRPSMHASEMLPLVRGLTVETEVWQQLMAYITGADSRQAWTARLTLGTGRILSARFASLPDGSTMAVFGDVTDSERIATALRERNEALESVEEMRSAVMDRISHQLRTPLNTIFGFGQLIADSRFGTLTEAQRSYSESILESARHLLATIDDVTELAALEIDSLQNMGSGLSLPSTLLLTGRLLEKRATEEGVILRVAAPKDDCEPACDAGPLRQIVFSMTTDAIHRCSDGGTIELSARAGDTDWVEIFTLETCGDGLPADTAQAEAASLTLPFLRRLVAREGGTIELRLVPGAASGEIRLSAICHLPGHTSLDDPNPVDQASLAVPVESAAARKLE